MVSTPEMVDLVNALILADKRIFLNNWEFLWIQYKKLYIMTLHFLRLIIVRFPKC